ncbi:hypothetical protein EVAR_54677_1 [Eumeta japonica]|uniref:Uncharacterized protein n=1 Tax=Eumeta variegata TaxID=151549 RepID=A0A4C1X6U3_EUMVA|nr:hypothetical protein EVAR_54677_1 [Eumeta japonica]
MCHAPAETLDIPRERAASWILAGSQAQYGESFSLNLCRYCENPPCPVRVCAKWDVISVFGGPGSPPNHPFRVRQRKLIIDRCRLLGEGGAPGELVRTLVSRDSGMRSNKISAQPCLPQRSEMSRLASWAEARPSPPERPCRRDRVVASSTKSPFRPATPSGPPDFAFNTATVGENARPDDGETVHSGVEVPTLSYPTSTCAGTLYGEPACLQSDAALDSVEHLRTPSFLVAGAQAHEAYRTIGSITVMYMVSISDSDPTSPWLLSPCKH